MLCYLLLLKVDTGTISLSNVSSRLKILFIDVLHIKNQKTNFHFFAHVHKKSILTSSFCQKNTNKNCSTLHFYLFSLNI